MIEITLLLILASAGASFIVTRSFLFEAFRTSFLSHEKLTVLLNCPQCFSFWCNLFFSLFIGPLWNYGACFFILYALATSFATSGLCYTINAFIEKE